MIPCAAFLRPTCSLLLLILHGHFGSLTEQARVKCPLVRILLVVENIQIRSLEGHD